MAKHIKLAPQYSQQRGFTDKIILTYADIILLTSGSAYSIFPNALGALVAAASADTIPAGTIVKQAAVRVTTAFASALDTVTLVAVIGDGSDTARYLASVTLKTAVYKAITLKMPFMYVAADTIDIIPTAGVEAITVLTAGEMEIYLELVDASVLNRPTYLS